MDEGAAIERLLGDLECVRDGNRRVPGAERPPLTWKPLPELEDRADLYAEVRLPSDYAQPDPLRLRVLFEPDPPGVYDIQWLAPRGARAAVGEPLARAYRAADGQVFTQVADFPLVVTDHLVRRNERAVAGDQLLTVQVPSLALDLEPVRRLVDEMRTELAQAVNAMVKGYMGSIGQSGQVAKYTVPIQVTLRPEEGCERLMAQIVDALRGVDLADGDVLVTSEKIFAIAQGRLFPLRLLWQHDPKTTDRQGRQDLAAHLSRYVPGVTEADLLLSDSLTDWPDGPSATLGVADPNRVAHDLARRIERDLEVVVDVVVSDTDTGLDVRENLVNCITIGATPLGATAGLVLYECMRVANAAEFVRGSSRGIPLVLCKPHPRRRRREGLGEHRGYDGRLDAKRERLLGYA